MSGLICILHDRDELSFVHLWAVLSILSAVFMTVASLLLFIPLYVFPSFQVWKYKINPEFPSPVKVKEEISAMLRGVCCSTICPAAAIVMTRFRYGHGYCGSLVPYGWVNMCFTMAVVWLLTDFYQFLYHWSGHTFRFMWFLHKDHHHFYNPSPFAVVADSAVDQFFRAFPMLLFPMIMSVNLDLLFGLFSTIFLINGLLQHSGYDFSFMFYNSHSR
jgi:sterol desaturase/sphingolipid hydroxylase (fatty acid hydroxylase superfamily)